jgi:hypothetical protein
VNQIYLSWLPVPLDYHITVVSCNCFLPELPVVNDYIDLFLWLQVKAETSVAVQAEIQQLHEKY